MISMFLFLMGNPESGGYLNLIFLALIFAVFYFFIIRPQTKRQKEIQKKVSEMQKGDKVVTSGGVVGYVNAVEDDSILMEIDNGVKARILKSAITDVNPSKDDKN